MDQYTQGKHRPLFFNLCSISQVTRLAAVPSMILSRTLSSFYLTSAQCLDWRFSHYTILCPCSVSWLFCMISKPVAEHKGQSKKNQSVRSVLYGEAVWPSGDGISHIDSNADSRLLPSAVSIYILWLVNSALCVLCLHWQQRRLTFATKRRYFYFIYCTWLVHSVHFSRLCRVYMNNNTDARLLPNRAVSALHIVTDWWILCTFLDCVMLMNIIIIVYAYDFLLQARCINNCYSYYIHGIGKQ